MVESADEVVDDVVDGAGSERQALIDALAQTSFATMAVLTKVAAEYELSLTQLRVLAILQDRRLRMSQLADYLGLDKSTLTGLVDRAVQRGLLHRERNSADGRAFDVLISDVGAELAGRVFARVAELLAPTIDRLGRADQRRLRALLEGTLGPGPGRI